MYVNLNPTNPTSFANGGTAGTTSTEDYLTKFCTEVLPSIQGRKILSTDVYALKKTVFNENVIDDRWVERLSTYGWFAKEYDCDFHFFLQSYSAGNERDIVDKADLTFQVYTDMAFGVNAFSWFTYRKSFLDGFGGGCVNDVVIHLATSEMGFGGVGESGMGAYHGKTGFETFSHSKSIVDKKTWMDLPMRYQPYKSKLYGKLLHMFLR